METPADELLEAPRRKVRKWSSPTELAMAAVTHTRECAWCQRAMTRDQQCAQGRELGRKLARAVLRSTPIGDVEGAARVAHLAPGGGEA